MIYTLMNMRVYSSLAQSVEHLTVNQGVTGSSPVGGAKKESRPNGLLFLFAFPLPVLEQHCHPAPSPRGTGEKPQSGFSFEALAPK